MIAFYFFCAGIGLGAVLGAAWGLDRRDAR